MLTDPHAIIEYILIQEGGDKVVVDTGGTTKWGISEKGPAGVQTKSKP